MLRSWRLGAGRFGPVGDLRECVDGFSAELAEHPFLSFVHLVSNGLEVRPYFFCNLALFVFSHRSSFCAKCDLRLFRDPMTQASKLDKGVGRWHRARTVSRLDFSSPVRLGLFGRVCGCVTDGPEPCLVPSCVVVEVGVDVGGRPGSVRGCL